MNTTTTDELVLKQDLLVWVKTLTHNHPTLVHQIEAKPLSTTFAKTPEPEQRRIATDEQICQKKFYTPVNRLGWNVQGIREGAQAATRPVIAKPF